MEKEAKTVKFVVSRKEGDDGEALYRAIDRVNAAQRLLGISETPFVTGWKGGKDIVICDLSGYVGLKNALFNAHFKFEVQ